MKAITTIVVAAAMLAAAHGSAIAQDSPDQGLWSGPMMGFGFPPAAMMGYGRGGPGMMRWGWNGSGQTMCNAMAGHIEGRLAFVKAELKITTEQEALWNTYAGAARDSANTMLARCTAMTNQRKSSASLPDRLDQNEQLMTAQLNALRATNAALKPLYAALTDSQKKSADQLFVSPMGMM
jgi:hypothetical protein